MTKAIVREVMVEPFNPRRWFRTDIEGYMAGKDAFVKNLEARALAWRRANGTDYRG